ncbi:extensin-like isoform X3 [Coregonus clupeaformis]|uniref:extensin-like isoform X3 n=1 Tax=Coregonus clupeaformis TaxID=59861 RepID=UPI001E1C6434|nr:extensin-like isoform X3 [Coregonus clupeaformis]
MLFHSCWKVDCQFVTGEHSSSADMKSCLWIALLVTLAIGTKTQDFDLSDAFDSDDPIPTTIPKQPKQPAKDPSPGGGFDLLDALGPEEPEKPAGIPPKEGGTDPKPAPPPAPVDPKKPAGAANRRKKYESYIPPHAVTLPGRRAVHSERSANRFIFGGAAHRHKSWSNLLVLISQVYWRTETK